MKKTVSLALMLMMLVTAFAELPEYDGFKPCLEPVTITVLSTGMSAVDPDPSVPGASSYQDNNWIDAYEKYLNIKVNRLIAEDGTALNSQLTTMMSSNELPDVFIASSDLYYTMLENGVLLDLTETYEWAKEELPSFAEAVQNDGEDFMTHYSQAGKIYALPWFYAPWGNENVFWIRQDWLNKLDLPVPTTVDEVLETAEAFKEAAFGGENTYGLAFFGGTINDFVGSYGVSMGTWIETDDGYVYADADVESMKEPLLALQDAYAKGLLKTDFSVTKELDSDVANGLCGIVYGPTWYSATAIGSNYINDESAEWYGTFFPSTEEGVEAPVYSETGAFQTAIMVSTNCKNPDAVFRMLDMELFIRNIDNSGIFTDSLISTPEGYQMWNLKVFRSIDPGFKYTTGTYNDARECLRQVLAGETTLEDYQFVDSTAQMLATAGVSFYTTGKRADAGLAITMMFGEIQTGKRMDEYGVSHFVNPYYGPKTDNMLVQDTINDNLKAAMIKVIMGEDFETYVAAVADWYNNGGDKITEDVNAYYDSL